ncbi:uncharacterized protein LOC133317860 isoform X2 [Gastrolobium bilobum]|uniref:uncharacterized protein LOC133317860 isoform X2 n=1 Tax=Gastrolobium bilobum TaxID=150636 RepID=UPI002AB27195|nr:uncharacterized protein LOC133317860 isoform X2 [Gastrolobium bilobum]
MHPFSVPCLYYYTYYKSIYIPPASQFRSSFKLAIPNFMDPKLRIYIFILLLLFVELYPGRVNSLMIRVDVLKPPTEMKGRQLMKVDTDDYRESDSNHRNDQGKGKPHV